MRMNGVSRDYPGGACNEQFVGCSGATRPINQNTHPLIKIYSPTVICICGGDPIRNSYFNSDFAKSCLPSLFKSVLSVPEALLLLLLLHFFCDLFDLCL
jgi:hypothetical protein